MLVWILLSILFHSCNTNLLLYYLVFWRHKFLVAIYYCEMALGNFGIFSFVDCLCCHHFPSVIAWTGSSAVECLCSLLSSRFWSLAPEQKKRKEGSQSISLCFHLFFYKISPWYWWEDSVVKRACCQGWWPESNLQGTHCGRRGATPTSVPWPPYPSIPCVLYMHTYAHRHTHTLSKFKS